MKLGYARVSTADQSLDFQLAALKKSGCQRIFREKVSGIQRQRTELQRLLDQLRAGDTLVVWRLDRLARSTRDLLDIMETIHGAEASFRSLSEPWADTTTHAGKMILTVFAGIAEIRAGPHSRANRRREESRQGQWRAFRTPKKAQRRAARPGTTLVARGQIRGRDRQNISGPLHDDLPTGGNRGLA